MLGTTALLARVRRSGVLRVGHALEAPDAVLDPLGQPSGESPEVARAVAERLGLGTAWILASFDHLIPDLLTDRFDLIAAGMSITPERARQVRFTRPTLRVRPGWLTQASRPLTLDYSAVQPSDNFRIAVLQGSAEEALFHQRPVPADSLLSVADARSGQTAVLLGQAGALALSLPTVQAMALASEGRLGRPVPRWARAPPPSKWPRPCVSPTSAWPMPWTRRWRATWAAPPTWPCWPASGWVQRICPPHTMTSNDTSLPSLPPTTSHELAATTGRRWLLAMAQGALAVMLALLLDRAEQSETGRTADCLLRIKRAADDLYLGAMHLRLGGPPDSPWQQDPGRALLGQAREELAPLVTLTRSAQEIHAPQAIIEELLAIWSDGQSAQEGQKLQARQLMHDLTTRLDKLGDQVRAIDAERTGRLRQIGLLSVALAGLLFCGLCLGALRAEQRWRAAGRALVQSESRMRSTLTAMAEVSSFATRRAGCWTATRRPSSCWSRRPDRARGPSSSNPASTRSAKTARRCPARRTRCTRPFTAVGPSGIA